MLENILEKIKEFDTIIIHRHIRPDGDAIGSQIGLKKWIEYNFKDKHVYAVGEKVQEYLRFVAEYDEISADTYKDALVIVVDTATSERISDDRWQTGKYLIKIDHHDDSPDFGDIHYTDASMPSCAAIISQMLASWEGYTIPVDAARVMYLGIVTDTGRFRYRGVNAEVLTCAANLLATGFDVQDLYDHLYIDNLETLKLQGYLLNNFKTTPNGVCYMYFTKKMMKKYHVTKEEAGNLVNSLGNIENYIIWVAFIDQMKAKEKNPVNKNEPAEKEIRVRLRSRRVAINDIASSFRGGGHLQAAGSTIYSKKEMKELIKQLDQRAKEFKEANPDVK